MIKGFEPIYSEGCEVLILGSFPSVKSREIGFYYGNPRNVSFTKIPWLNALKFLAKNSE